MTDKTSNKLQINWLSQDDLYSEFPITLYDHLPYRHNPEICSPNHIELVSGNLYKYYTCKESGTPITIENHDQEVELYQRLHEESEEV